MRRILATAVVTVLLGNGVAAASSLVPVGNLTLNPSFETHPGGGSDRGRTVGWVASRLGSPATLGMIRPAGGARDGSFVGSVAANGARAFGVQPATAVAATIAGESYTAGASVKQGGPSSNGDPIWLGITETTASGAIVQEPKKITKLGSGWKRLTLTTTAMYTGDLITVLVEDGSAARKHSFLVDAITLTNGNTTVNPSFWPDTTGWYPYRATATVGNDRFIKASPLGGSYAWVREGAKAAHYQIGATVPNPGAGLYTVAVSVAAGGASSVGQPIQLTVADSFHEPFTLRSTLSRSWQRLVLSPALGGPSDRFSVYVKSDTNLTGQSFAVASFTFEPWPGF